MEELSWFGLLVGCASVLLLVALAVEELQQRTRARGNTPIVALVRRRHKLTQRLNELAGERSSDLLRLESRRLGASTASFEVLEAAIERAERLPPGVIPS
jgi:hypothetical protein